MIKLTEYIVQILLMILAAAGSVHYLKLRQKMTIVLCCCCIGMFSFLSLKFVEEFLGLKEELIITALNEKCAESRGPEVDIMNLWIDGDVISYDDIVHDVVQGHWYIASGHYAWRPQEDTRFDGTATESITLSIPVGWERSVQFHGNAWRGYAIVKKPDGAKATINTYSEDNQIYSCWIGRSDTKMLLLNGIVKTFSFAAILAILTYLFIWVISKSMVDEGTEECQIMTQDRQLSNPKKIWIMSFLLTGTLAFLIMTFAVANLRERIKTEAVILPLAAKTESTPITEKECYTQRFKSDGTFNQIRLKFCSYGRENKSSTTVQLTVPSTGEVLGNWEVDNNSIGNDEITFALKHETGKGVYQLIVEGHNPEAETSIGIYLQDSSVYDGELLISGIVQNQNISIGLYQKTNIGYYMLIIVLSAAVLCTWIAFVLIFIWKLEWWKTAFVLIMSFGCVYLAIFPSVCVNDSWKHYITAYQYSNDFWGIKPSKEGTVMMRKDDYDEYCRFWKLGNYPGTGISPYFEEFDEFSIWCQDSSLVDCGARSLANTGGSASSIVASFPQALGLTLGRILSMGTIPCLFLARFFQLFAVSALISTAIKILPKGKEIFLMIALLPIFLQQITAFSYDGIAFGFAFLFIAFCIKLKTQMKNVSVCNCMFLLIATVGLCSCRGGMYIFLLILFILIPKQVLGKGLKIYLLGMGFFTLLLFFGGSYFSASTVVTGKSELIWGSPLQHPINVGLHFVSSVIDNIDIYWFGLFGNRMGWHEAIIPYSITFGFIVMLLIASLSVYNTDQDCAEFIDAKTRFVYLLPVVLTFGFCICVMYLGNNEHATKWNIWGVQGRYLIPVIPLLFFQIENRFVVLKKNIKPAMAYMFCVWEVVEIFYLMRIYVIR